MNKESVKAVEYAVGDSVWAQYGGEGVIQKITPLHFVVTLKNWQLADGKSPTLFLAADAITPLADRAIVEKVRKLALEDAAASSSKGKTKEETLRESIDKAVSLKNLAASHFKKEAYSEACQAYLDALECMNKMGYDMPDPFRAEVLEHTIPCHNNIALCCMKDKKYEEAKIYANNGVMLIDAMCDQINSTKSNVWGEFMKRGMTLNKLTKDWKKKSLFYKGKACLLQREYDGACSNFELALDLVKDDATMVKQAKELTDFLAQARKLRLMAQKKEKDTWKKAFSKNSEEGKKTTPAAASASVATEPAAAAAAAPKSPPRTTKLEKVETAAAKPKVDINKYLKGAPTAPAATTPAAAPAAAPIPAPAASPVEEDTAMPSSSTDAAAIADSDGLGKEEDDNTTMLLVGGAVALALGLGAVGYLTRRR
jgi:tetratricopeptide (TPR) repeat protein